MTTVIDTPKGIEMFHLLQLKYALHLEILGLRQSRGSTYAYIKRHFGLRGDRKKVYEDFCAFIETKK